MSKEMMTWYDPYIGTVWEATETEVLDAINSFNEVYELKGYVTLNTLRYFLHLPLDKRALNYIWVFNPLEEDIPVINFAYTKYYTEDSEGFHDTGLWVMRPSEEPVYDEHFRQRGY